MSSVPWAIQGEEKQKFDKIFTSLGPMDGKLSGDKVKPVLLNSKLPFDLLGKVWELSDIDKDGMLDQDEFCVAMHIVYQALENNPVPQSLPSKLIPPSKRKSGLTMAGAVPVLPQVNLGAVSLSKPKVSEPLADFSNLSILSPQHTGSSTTSGGLLQPTSLSSNTTPVHSAQNSNRIIIPEDEKVRFGGIFRQHAIDGYIEGVAARDVFIQSGQPQNVLAHVWNMCDEHKLGKLTQDQFMLSMHFIMLKVRGMEIPGQLTSDMMPFSSTDSGFGDNNKDSGSFSDTSSGVGDFSAVRELDTLNREIEDLRREKDTLTKEIREKEVTIRQRSHEVQELQDQVDRSSTSLSLLESDKVESHDRLNELEQQQLKLDGMLAELRRKVNDEQNTITKLKEEIKDQDMAVKKQEEDYAKVQKELQGYMQEEVQLQQRLDAGKQQLQSVGKQIEETNNEIFKTQSQIESLKEQQKTVTSNIQEYDKAVTALKSDTSENDKAYKLNVLPELSTSSAFNDDIFNKSDPFKSDDPFKSNNDPFAETNVFSSNQQNTGFDSDPFASAQTTTHNTKDDFFSDRNADPFDSKDASKDPFSDDNDLFKDKSDPFAKNDAFGGEETATGFDSAFSRDPFDKSDVFSSGSESLKSANTSGSKKEKVLFKTTFDNDDSSDFFGGLKDSKTGGNSNVGDDPWGFPSSGSKASTNTNTSNNLFSAKSDLFGSDSFEFKGSKTADTQALKTEDDQLAWVAAQSKKEEEERKEKLRLQEQADLEYAIKLSKQDP